MNITELDEWQGLTAELVQQWAEAHGYQYRISGLVKGGYVSFANPLRPDAIVWLVPLLADRAKLSLQAFLCEINPRMRKGMPSEAAREAHPGGLWLATPDFACIGAHVPVVVTFDGDGFGVWHPEGFALPDSKPKTAALWHFWPCDANGNKVRWPTDAEGNML